LRKSGELIGQLRKMTLYIKWTSFFYGSWRETCCNPVINLFTVVNFIERGEKESFKHLTDKNLDF